MHLPIHERLQHLTRRTFLGDITRGIGSVALGSLLFPGLARAAEAAGVIGTTTSKLPHFAPKAKRVLCLFQSEGFSHVDLFDSKPALAQNHGKDLPPSVKGTQRITGMTSGQAHFP